MASTMTMNPPHRKPVPRGYDPAYTSAMQAQPTSRQPSSQFTRTTPMAGMNSPSTSAYAMSASQHPSPYPSPPVVAAAAAATSSRRTLSNATSSTSSTSTHAGLQKVPTNSTYAAAGGVRRSTSSRSNNSLSPTSYVALMRKQKATVWCDRAQHEDPRILAAQRQAKMRAAAEVAGGHHHNNSAPLARAGAGTQGMVGGVRSKIRHHGAPKASAYMGVGGPGVPMRLSASEVDEKDSDDETLSSSHGRAHARNGSGRSSLGSGLRVQSYQSSGLHHSYSNGSTPPLAGHSPVESMGDVAEEETPMPHDRSPAAAGDDYFAQPGGGSGSSGEREDTFGSVGGLPYARGKPSAQEQADVKHYSADELRRRGSVDDRTMTMSAVRLFVANPDLSD